jgi:hypothetical protein
MRFEITGTATDIWSTETIQDALRPTKAMAVSKRRANGMSNQPYVATFAAQDQVAADIIVAEARTRIPNIQAFGSLPVLIARPYCCPPILSANRRN